MVKQDKSQKRRHDALLNSKSNSNRVQFLSQQRLLRKGRKDSRKRRKRVVVKAGNYGNCCEKAPLSCDGSGPASGPLERGETRPRLLRGLRPLRPPFWTPARLLAR